MGGTVPTTVETKPSGEISECMTELSASVSLLFEKAAELEKRLQGILMPEEATPTPKEQAPTRCTPLGRDLESMVRRLVELQIYLDGIRRRVNL